MMQLTRNLADGSQICQFLPFRRVLFRVGLNIRKSSTVLGDATNVEYLVYDSESCIEAVEGNLKLGLSASNVQ